MLPRTTGNEEHYLPFAVDLKISVKVILDQKKTPVYRTTNTDNTIYFYRWEIFTTVYTLNNKSNKDCEVFIEHPRVSNRELHETPRPHEKLDHFYRFLIKSNSNKIEKFVVREKKADYETVQFSSLEGKVVDNWYKQGIIPTDFYERCKKIVEIKSEIEKLNQQSTLHAEHANRLSDEQNRILRILSALSPFKATDKPLSAVHKAVGESSEFKDGLQYFTNMKLQVDNSASSFSKQKFEIEELLKKLNEQIKQVCQSHIDFQPAKE